MKEVFVIQGEVDYEGYDVLGIFATQEEAVSSLKAHIDSIEIFDRYDWYQVCKYPFGRQFDKFGDDSGETVFECKFEGTF